MRELDRVHDQVIESGDYVQFGDMGLAFALETPFEVWEAVTFQLLKAEKSIRWWIGDALRFGEATYGEKYTQAMEATGYSYSTLSQSVWVANKYPEMSLRKENCTFRQHEVVAALEPDEREEVLEIASQKGWTDRQLRDEVAERKTLPQNFSPAEVSRLVECPNCGGTGKVLDRNV